jgi:uncharacterized membrane protein
MGKDRLEAFTDGVVAIIITIMVLEVKAPQGGGLAGIPEQLPMFLAYVLSYITIRRWVLWANLNLLFWLTLIPFVIRWMDERGLTPFPVATYGAAGNGGNRLQSLLERAIIAATAAPRGSLSRLAMTSRAGCRSACISCRSRSPS